MPGLVRKYVEFWDGVVLQDHPLRETLVSYLRDGVSVHEFLFDSHRGASVDLPYKTDRFPGAVFSNRIPPTHADFADAEMHSLIARGCVAAVYWGIWSAADTSTILNALQQQQNMNGANCIVSARSGFAQKLRALALRS